MSSRRADDLRALRLDKRLTQTEAAKKFGVSQAYWSQIENGQKPREILAAKETISHMRARTDRTAGGGDKAGRKK